MVGLLTVICLIEILDKVTKNDCRAGDKHLYQFCADATAAGNVLTTRRDPNVARNGGIRGLHQQSPR
jgi:hypothetical protein